MDDPKAGFVVEIFKFFYLLFMLSDSKNIRNWNNFEIMKSISKRGFWIKWEIVLNENIEIGHVLDGSLKKGIFLKKKKGFLFILS